MEADEVRRILGSDYPRIVARSARVGTPRGRRGPRAAAPRLLRGSVGARKGRVLPIVAAYP
jgi:hypothetical protein